MFSSPWDEAPSFTQSFVVVVVCVESWNFIFIHGCFGACMSVNCVSGVPKKGRTGIRFPRTGFTGMSYHISAEKRTQVLWKRSESS